MLRHQNTEMLRSASDSRQRIKLNPLTAFPNYEREATKNSEKTKIFSEFFWKMSESFGNISDVLGEYSEIANFNPNRSLGPEQISLDC